MVHPGLIIFYYLCCFPPLTSHYHASPTLPFQTCRHSTVRGSCVPLYDFLFCRGMCPAYGPWFPDRRSKSDHLYSHSILLNSISFTSSCSRACSQCKCMQQYHLLPPALINLAVIFYPFLPRLALSKHFIFCFLWCVPLIPPLTLPTTEVYSRFLYTYSVQFYTISSSSISATSRHFALAARASWRSPGPFILTSSL